MLFPYFGAKSKAAEAVWNHLGDPECYIEPFAGSLAVLLARPTVPRVEIAVDLDGLLVNFWRTIKYDYAAMEQYLSLAVSEVDIHAKHAVLLSVRAALTKNLREDPRYYSAELAAWWWEGISSWLGSGYGWRLSKQRPHVDRSLKGVWATRMTDEKIDWVSRRLGNVVLLAGDWQDAWKRPVTDAIINRFHRGVGVFLDPPYAGERAKGLYAEDKALSEQIMEWCVRQPRHVRVVIAGYEDEYPAFADAREWKMVAWKAPNGYAQKANDRRGSEVLYLREWRRVIKRAATPIPA